MTRTTIAWALALSTAIATPVLAQTDTQAPAASGTMVKQPDAGAAMTPAPAAGQAGTFLTEAQLGQYRASKLVGVNIYNSASENIGEVNEIIVDGTGKIDAVVIGVGGFLGIGEKNVALPFGSVKWTDEPLKTAANTNPPAATTAPGTGGAMTPAPTPAGGTDTTGAVAAASGPKDYPDHGMVEMSKDQLKNAPEFKYNSQK
jgi:sporulation protein YlmC with PRC-barrel domain